MNKKREFRKGVYLADYYKKRLLNELERLNIRYKSGIISKNEYESRLVNLLRGRSVDDWLNYYDKYKSACLNKIHEDENDLKFRTFFLILLFGVLLFPFLTNYTGMIISDATNRVYINKVVSPDAYLLIDGVAEPIPLELELINGEYTYDITYLTFEEDISNIAVVDNGDVVFSKELK